MSITREPNTVYILSLSYGKDSLACLGAIKELGYPLDRIIHAEVWATDTIPADLPPMVEFKKKADEIIKQTYGLEVEHICATSRERERESPTKNSSTQSTNHEEPTRSTPVICTDSQEQSVLGVTADLKSKPFLKVTYERLFYQMPQRKTNRRLQGTYRGFPISAVRGNWCTALKTTNFHKAPLHKELT